MNVTEEDDFQKSCVIFGTTYLIITKLPSEKLVINQFFVIVFNAIVIIPTLLLNGVAAITICKSSQLISKPCYFILLLQCTFDLVLGLLGIPLFIFFLANAVGGISNCFAVFFARRLTYASIGGSSIALVAMTMERYIAILHPFTYNTRVTKKRLLKYVGASVTVEFFLLIFSFTSQWLVEIYASVKVTLVFFITAYVYTKIYWVVKKLECLQKKPRDTAERNKFNKNEVVFSRN